MNVSNVYMLFLSIFTHCYTNETFALFHILMLWRAVFYLTHPSVCIVFHSASMHVQWLLHFEQQQQIVIVFAKIAFIPLMNLDISYASLFCIPFWQFDAHGILNLNTMYKLTSWCNWNQVFQNILTQSIKYFECLSYKNDLIT